MVTAVFVTYIKYIDKDNIVQDTQLVGTVIHKSLSVRERHISVLQGQAEVRNAKYAANNRNCVTYDVKATIRPDVIWLHPADLRKVMGSVCLIFFNVTIRCLRVSTGYIFAEQLNCLSQ